MFKRQRLNRTLPLKIPHQPRKGHHRTHSRRQLAQQLIFLSQIKIIGLNANSMQGGLASGDRRQKSHFTALKQVLVPVDNHLINRH